MKVLLGVVALVAALLSTGIQAQSGVTYPNGQCDFEPASAPVMFTCIDWVNPATGTVAGWSFDKNTGNPPQGLQLWIVNGSTVSLVPTSREIVSRPDVDAAFGLTNPSVGYGLVASAPLAPGTYAVLSADVPYSQTCGYDPNNGLWCGYAANEVVFTVH